MAEENDGLMRKAIDTIRGLRAELDTERARWNEPIAVVGLACRFPGGANDPQAFWRLLEERRDAIGNPPAGREAMEGGPLPPAGYLQIEEGCDAAFFGISRSELTRTDPQQTLMLEVVWHALESAGIRAEQLRGSATGVFIAVSNSDHARRELASSETVGAYSVAGSLLSMVPNRISHFLDLRGPSVAIDTACSSGLVAVHSGIQDLRLGVCDMAIVGGVNLILSAVPARAYGELSVASPTSRCRPFDSRADGFVRGEGCGAIILKTLSRAKRDGDEILAVLRGSAVSHGGRGPALTAPSPRAQADVMRAALRNAGLAAGAVGYVEAHGTGTSLGDPIEVDALSEVYGSVAGSPCVLGAVKGNIGHLEAAAGIAGLIKTIMVLRDGRIPGTTHFERLNPEIDLGGTRLKIAVGAEDWPTSSGERIGAVSAFGIGGTNAHVIVSEPPRAEQVEHLPLDENRHPSVLMLSAHSRGSLTRLTDAYRSSLLAGAVDYRTACDGAARARSRFSHRLAVIAEHGSEAEEALAGWRDNGTHRAVLEGEAFAQPSLAFGFSGQGGARALPPLSALGALPGFRDHLSETYAPFTHHVHGELETAFRAPDAVSETGFQVVLFCLQYALSKAWQEIGVAPGYTFGHSLGEYAAACVAGAFDLDTGVALVAERSKLLESGPKGAMLALSTSAEGTASLIGEAGGDVWIAALNAPTETVVSGTLASVSRLAEVAAAAGVRTQSLPVSVPYHSPLLESVAQAFENRIGGYAFRSPSLRFVSSMMGALASSEVSTAAYWARHLLEPVRFHSAVGVLLGQSCTTVLEIGPDARLSALGARCADGSVPRWIPSLRGAKQADVQLARARAGLFLAGHEVSLPSSGDPVRGSALPLYPFDRERVVARSAERATTRAFVTTPVHAAAERGPEVMVADTDPSTPADREVGDRDQVLRRMASLVASVVPQAAREVAWDEPLQKALGLDSVGVVELKDTVHRQFPNVSIPLTRMLQGITLFEIVDEILAATVQPQSRAARERTAADEQAAYRAGLRAIEVWSRDKIAADLRIDKRLVHKASEDNVLLSRIEPVDPHPGWFVGQVRHALDHSFFYEHPKDHVPSIYLFEAAKQFITAVGHAFVGIPMNRPFIVESFGLSFFRFAETNVPLFLLGQIYAVHGEGGLIEQAEYRAHIIQEGRVIGRGTCLLNGFEAADYVRLRSDRAIVDDWSSNRHAETYHHAE